MYNDFPLRRDARPARRVSAGTTRCPFAYRLEGRERRVFFEKSASA
jgi:hypothetical protein